MTPSAARNWPEWPREPAEDCLAYHSFLNIRPRQGNRGVEIEDSGLRERMRGIIARRVPL